MLEGLRIELYRFAIANPGWNTADASDALGYPRRDIDAALTDLQARRLVSSAANGHSGYVAVSPDVAIADLVDEDERAILHLRTSVANRRRELMSLVPTFLEARKFTSATSPVEILEDPAMVQRLLIELGRDVTEQVLMSQPGQGSTADVQEDNVRKDVELLEKGVQRRTLYHASTRDHVPTRKAVAAIERAGGEFRVLPYMPLRMLIFDKKLALVARHLHENDKAGLVIRDSNLVQILTRFFDFAWDLAESFDVETSEKSPLSSRQQSILNGLAVGYSDEVIARRLDINVRTCRRDIAWMLEQLGADSRFQAGLKARDAGWI